MKVVSNSGFQRAEVTEGAMRAVGFGRQEIFNDVALRYRFAYSLEHYDVSGANFLLLKYSES